MIRAENVLKISSRHFCYTLWGCFEDVFDVLKISSKRFQDVFKTSSRRLEDVLKTLLQDILKTSWKRLQDVWPKRINSSWSKRLPDVSWRGITMVNIFVLIKTFLRRLLITKMKDVFIKTNVCWEMCIQKSVKHLRWSFLQK